MERKIFTRKTNSFVSDGLKFDGVKKTVKNFQNTKNLSIYKYQPNVWEMYFQKKKEKEKKSREKFDIEETVNI